MNCKYENRLSFKGMATTFELAVWRDDASKNGDRKKAVRIQKVIDKRGIQHGGHIAYRD